MISSSPPVSSCASRVLARVEAALPSLSPAEQRVGRLLLRDACGFAARPVAELALQARVSKPTVVRFCRSVGCDGLTDLKSKLKTGAQEGVPLIHSSVNFGDKAGDIMVKVVDNALAAYMHHRRQNCVRVLEQTTARIMDCHSGGHKLEFVGVGTSGIVAQDAQRKFSRLGMYAQAHSDGVFQAMNATLLRTGDCMVVISNSGRSREMLALAQIAKSHGAAVVAITASGSPLAQLADHHLVADHTEDFEFYEPMVSRLIHLLVIDVLATCVAMAMGYEQLQPLLSEAKHSLCNKLYS